MIFLGSMCGMHIEPYGGWTYPPTLIHPHTPTPPTVLERHGPLVVATVNMGKGQRPQLTYRTLQNIPK